MARDPLWGKAPLALLRMPRLLLALAFGAFLLVLATAIEPLFVAAEASRLVKLVGLIGGSGSGKTTLMNVIAG